MNLKIVELELKARPLNILEVREQREATVKDVVAAIDSAVKDYTVLFKQSLEVVTSLWEDSNVQRLETEAWELQQRYEEVKETVRTVTITQRLMRLQEEMVLKYKVEAA